MARASLRYFGLPSGSFILTTRGPSQTFCRSRLLAVQVVCGRQPLLHVAINLFCGGNFNAVSNAVLFCQSTRINQPLRQLSSVVCQREAKIDPGICGWLDLRKPMLAIQWHNRLARARPHVIAKRLAEL